MAGRQSNTFFDEEFLARLQRLHLIAKRMAARMGGARRSRRLGDGLEFADHRDYAPGDDVRFIDWPYFARMERLLLRLFHQHSEMDVAVLLDCSASMAAGGDARKFDYARRAAAALAYVAMGSLERVAMVPFAEDLGEPLRTGRNRAEIFRVLDFLGGLRPAGRTDLARCAERFTARQEGGGTVLVLSDLLDCSDDLSDALARLSFRGHETTVLHVCAPDEASPALEGDMLLRHAETGRQMGVNVGSELLESYRRGWLRFVRGCERACLSRGCTYVAAPTDLPFERLVLHSLRRAGVLAG